ncbi:hypothetical protein HBB16_20235 [Pseudonocardia sp. MCCB 268]|nr:hypothetical protein [Pseudonocardia cytotoxica]
MSGSAVAPVPARRRARCGEYPSATSAAALATPSSSRRSRPSYPGAWGHDGLAGAGSAGSTGSRRRGTARYPSDIRMEWHARGGGGPSAAAPSHGHRADDPWPALELPGVVCVLGPDEVVDYPRRAGVSGPARGAGGVLTGAPMFVGDAVAAVVACDRATARACRGPGGGRLRGASSCA